MYEIQVTGEQQNKLDEGNPTIIKGVGCGGGGSNAVKRLIETDVKGVEYIVINTDLQALNKSPAGKRLAIGQKLTGGLGAGGNPEVGENAAIEDTEMIKKELEGANMVVITCGMGGGTGTGSAPIVAKIARDIGALTVAVVTTPFEFEGPARMAYAKSGLSKLRENVDSLIEIPNQKVLELDYVDENATFIESFNILDDVVCQGVRGITEIITVHGRVNCDFADVCTVMKHQHDAILGVGIGEGPNRAIDAALNAINNPLLDNRHIDGAKKVLYNIVGPESLTMKEIKDIGTTITCNAAPGHSVFWGQVVDPTMEDKVKVTVIATGFDEADAVVQKKEENDTMVDLGDFVNATRGKNFTATSPSNPGLYSSAENSNIFVPHENAFNNMELNSGDDFAVDPNNIQQPAFLRKKNFRFGSGINLSQE